MKLAAALFVGLLYLVWPYYTLLELAQAMRAGDAPTINRLVDWDQVRTSVKSQMQEHFDALPKSAADRSVTGRSSGSAVARSAFAYQMANSLVDKMLTPGRHFTPDGSAPRVGIGAPERAVGGPALKASVAKPFENPAAGRFRVLRIADTLPAGPRRLKALAYVAPRGFHDFDVQGNRLAGDRCAPAAGEQRIGPVRGESASAPCRIAAALAFPDVMAGHRPCPIYSACSRIPAS